MMVCLFVCLFVCLRREEWPDRLWEMNNLMSPLQSLLDDDIRE